MFRNEFSTDPIRIDLPAETVWEVLLDVAKYGEWNPFMPEARTDFQVGSAVHALLDAGPSKVRVKMTLYELDPPPRGLIAWGLVLIGKWLFGAVREQHLDAVDETSCEYWCRERMTGLLSPVVNLLSGAHMKRSYLAVGRELKRRAEGKHAEAQ
jgi:hypothetical protein